MRFAYDMAQQAAAAAEAAARTAQQLRAEIVAEKGEEVLEEEEKEEEQERGENNEGDFDARSISEGGFPDSGLVIEDDVTVEGDIGEEEIIEEEALGEIGEARISWEVCLIAQSSLPEVQVWRQQILHRLWRR